MQQSWGDRWPALERLLDQALDAAPGERVALVELTRSKDPTLAADLERLLEAESAATGFLTGNMSMRGAASSLAMERFTWRTAHLLAAARRWIAP